MNRVLPARELERLRISVNRDRPWGTPEWAERTARRLGLLFTPRNAGRPRKEKVNQ